MRIHRGVLSGLTSPPRRAVRTDKMAGNQAVAAREARQSSEPCGSATCMGCASLVNMVKEALAPPVPLGPAAVRNIMPEPLLRRGATNTLYPLVVVALIALAALGYMLFRGSSGSDRGQSSQELLVFCAAGMRYPMEQIAEDYEDEYGVRIQLSYGGSNTLLNQLEINPQGDLYLAADDSYIQLARSKGLADEALPLAKMKPVIAISRGNPRNIRAVDDLLRSDVRAALGNPDAAAVGKKARRLLKKSGHWKALEKHITETGVYKPTVNEVANDIKLGSVDAGIIWDATVAQYPELEPVAVPELDAGLVDITLGVLRSTSNPTAALRFARYVAARDKGLRVFADKGFETVDGDVWEVRPKLTFYAGSVNRRALEPILKEFSDREGVQINTVYNGCGILTAQMRTLQENQDNGFPDAYMACDVYYLETVKDWFQDDVNVSDTDIVIVVQKGNPKNIQSVEDLVRPKVRVAIGQPEQCTIGVLTRRLLQNAGIYDRMLENNVVTQTTTSALLVPNVSTGAVDAVLAYRTDTLDEQEKLEIIPVDSEMAKAIQPYSIARSSDFKHLGHRLYEQIAKSRKRFESAGFSWRLTESVAIDGANQPPKTP